MIRKYLELRREIHLLCLGAFINRAGSFVMVFLTIYISEKLDLGKSFAALCVGAYGLGAILGSLLGGQLADQFGRRRVMLSALLGGAACLLMLEQATSAFSVMAMTVAYGLVSETFRPACTAMIGDVTAPDQRPLAFGLHYISINLGFACGPPIGGLLADVSYSLLFWADALSMAAFALFIWRWIPESSASASSDETTRMPIVAAARRVIADRAFCVFCVATFLLSIVFMQCMVTLPIHIKNAGFTNFQFGLIMGLNGILIFVTQLPITNFMQRYNAMTSILIGAVMIALGFAMYQLPPTLLLLLMALVTWTVGEMMQAPFKQTVVTSLAPSEMRARYLGVYGMSYSLALTIGAPLGGFILAQQGSSVLWTSCTVVSAMAVVAYAISYRLIAARNDVSHQTELSACSS